MADSLGIEEANKIRIAMGMAPLPGSGASAPPSSLTFKSMEDADESDEPASTIETRQAAAYDNWKKLQDEQEAKRARDAKATKLKKEREKVQRFAKLEGKGLADVDDEDDMAWLKGSKKRQRRIAKAEMLAKQLEEREAQATKDYTEKDLRGIKVGHEIGEFDDGEDQILVLKDTAVDVDDEDDELEAVSLKEKEALERKLESKKRKRVYDPNDVDDSGQKSILAQYDEEIDGQKSKAFTLDGRGRTVEEVQAQATGAANPKKVAISLEILKDETPANDYISEIKAKKPKKKKSKSSKRQRIDDNEDMSVMSAGEIARDMEIAETENAAFSPKKKSLYDQSFVDDDDLQANLAAARQRALKKRKMRPEDIARQLREEASTPQTPEVIDSTEMLAQPALVIDETTEFVQNLGANINEEEEASRRKRQKFRSNGVDTAGVDGVQQDEEGDIHMQSYAEAAQSDDNRERSMSRARSIGITDTGLEQEKTVDQGVGATLALLRQRNMISDSDAAQKNALYRERQQFLADKQREEAAAERLRREARERERNSAQWSNLSAREREERARKMNAANDIVESRKIFDVFSREYKPNVELSYVDEFGRTMDAKEAFKQLSHQFHGKGSGNTKTKKHLDKIAAEKKRMAESSLETTRSGGIGNAQDQQAKKHKMAGVRLQ